ncbi:hypothetical protein OC845_003882 [Tilletia horrida]|nr:hypothetical protein OC845_003882 [Tilletia horrida]
MTSFNPYAAGYRSHNVDLSSSPNYRSSSLNQTSSPSPPSSPLFRAKDAMARDMIHSPPGRPGSSTAAVVRNMPSRAGSDALEPPVFTASSPSLKQHQPMFSSGSGSDSSATALSSSYERADSSLDISKAMPLMRHQSSMKPFASFPHPDYDLANPKRGLKRPLPTSPDAASRNGFSRMSSSRFADHSTDSERRVRRSAGRNRAAATFSPLTPEDEIALEMLPTNDQPGGSPSFAYAKDDVLGSAFADVSDSSDDSWADSSSPPLHALDIDSAAQSEQDALMATDEAIVSMPASRSEGMRWSLGPAFSPTSDAAKPAPSSNPYRRSMSRTFSRVPSAGLPHPLSASYVPSPPSQPTIRSHRRISSHAEQAEGLLGTYSLVSQAGADAAGLMEEPAASGDVDDATHEIWTREINKAFEHCETSIVLNDRGLRYIDPNVADLGKMVTLPPLRRSPSPNATPTSLHAPRNGSSAESEWIPNLKFGGCQLNLANNKLIALPSALFQVKNLRVLSLRGNEIRYLPPAIAELVNLKELNIGGNKIVRIQNRCFFEPAQAEESGLAQEYLPAEIQKLRLTTFTYFPNPFRKPPQSIPCPHRHAGTKGPCVHSTRLRVRPTWSLLVSLPKRPSEALSTSGSSQTPVKAVHIESVSQRREPVRQRPVGLSLRPLLLTHRSFGQSSLTSEDLRTPNNPLPEDPLLTSVGGAVDSTPLARSDSSTGLSSVGQGGASRMAPPPAPFRVSEQGPRFAHPNGHPAASQPLGTPTRLEEGATMESLQLGGPSMVTSTDQGFAAAELSNGMQANARFAAASNSRRPRVFDRTRSERQISEVLEGNMGDHGMLGTPPPQQQALSTREADLTAEVGTVAQPAVPTSERADPNPRPARPSAGLNGRIRIDNGRASHVSASEVADRGFPPLLGELCYRVLLSKDDDHSDSSTAASLTDAEHTPRQRESTSADSALPQLVLDRWDRDDLARLRGVQASGVLQTLEAARRSASKSWGSSATRKEEAERQWNRTRSFLKTQLETSSSSSGSSGGVAQAGVQLVSDEDANDAGADASANPWFSRCPNPEHVRRGADSVPTEAAQGELTSDWPIAPADQSRSPLFRRPAETRMEWVSHIAGYRIARPEVNTSVINLDTASPEALHGQADGGKALKEAALGQLVSEGECLPILWRGCSKGCLDFLDR